MGMVSRPFRAARVVAVTGDPRNRLTFYMGSTGGGVWKTSDGGISWRDVSDGYFQSASSRRAGSGSIRSERLRTA